MEEYKFREFGNRLKSIREKKNIKQGVLAEEIGITRQSIGNYESGKQYPTIDILIEMANRLECRLDYLLGRTDESGLPISKIEDEQLEKLRHYLDLLEKNEADYLIDAIVMTFYALSRDKENPQRLSFIADISEIHYALAEYIELSTNYNKRFSKQSNKNKLNTEEIVLALLHFNKLDELLHQSVQNIKNSCLIAAVPFLSDTIKPLKRKNSKTNELVEKLMKQLDKKE